MSRVVCFCGKSILNVQMCTIELQCTLILAPLEFKQELHGHEEMWGCGSFKGFLADLQCICYVHLAFSIIRNPFNGVCLLFSE